MPGLILAAPSSGSGKTTITLGLLRAFRNRGIAVQSAKSGPDYIDPRFHAAASGAECVNLDAWAMSPDRIKHLAQSNVPLFIEGAMGLFDGAPPDGRGACADLARILNLPVVLILDVASQAHSVAAVATGFANFDSAIKIAGVILNKVGSPRHEAMLRAALAPTNIPIFGAVHRNAKLAMPSRHLGLVQAGEHPELNSFLDIVAELVQQQIDLDALLTTTSSLPAPQNDHRRIQPPAQKIAIASDLAFAFAYPHLIVDWRAAGANISFFSPLADQAANPDADLVILPGGYPELHAGKLASNENFLSSLRSANSVYGECGGYMTMGEGLIDANGERHKMAGLFALETSFAKRKLSLGYRQLQPLGGLWDQPLMAHEFHYATTQKASGDPLFNARDAEGTDLGSIGLINGNHSGSFAHIIDRA